MVPIPEKVPDLALYPEAQILLEQERIIITVKAMQGSSNTGALPAFVLDLAFQTCVC